MRIGIVYTISVLESSRFQIEAARPRFGNDARFRTDLVYLFFFGSAEFEMPSQCSALSSSMILKQLVQNSFSTRFLFFDQLRHAADPTTAVSAFLSIHNFNRRLTVQTRSQSNTRPLTSSHNQPSMNMNQSIVYKEGSRCLSTRSVLFVETYGSRSSHYSSGHRFAKQYAIGSLKNRYLSLCEITLHFKAKSHCISRPNHTVFLGQITLHF